MKKIYIIILIVISAIYSNGQTFRDNFIGIYTGSVDSYDIGHASLPDRLYVEGSSSDTNNIVITDTIPGLNFVWLDFEYIVYTDSSFATNWIPYQHYGYFYSNGDSIFIHDVHNSPYFREWHCGRVGAGVNEVSASTFSIYPNPASNRLFIQPHKRYIYTQFALFNSIGQLVLEKNFSSFENKQEIELNSLSSGIYYILLKTATNTYSQKIVINN
jgi:hypothetical protein